MEAFRDMVKGWLGKTLLVLLVVPFAIVGIESYFAGGGKVVAANVNGEKILQSKVDQQVEAQRQQLLARMGSNVNAADLDIPRLRKNVLDGMISRELLAQQAGKDGYLVSDATINKVISEFPGFQEDGKFSQARFDQQARGRGFTPLEYVAELKKTQMSTLLLEGLGVSALVTGPELGRLASLGGQKRDVHVAMVPAARYLASVTVGDDEVRRFYESNPKRFTTEEGVALDYIMLKRDDLLAQAQPTEDDLQARYEERVKANSSSEQRQAQHILIKVDAKTTDADALKKIQDIEKRVRAGGDFGKLAKEFSQDEGSVANGGDLGMVGRGQFTPPFEKALFSLGEGEVSAPVKTEYGYHLIKLNRIQKTDVPAYAALKPALEKEAREAKADELYSDEADKMDAAVYEASDLKDPAEKFKRTIAGTAMFTRSGGAGIAADRKVIDAAFSDDLLKDGKNSQGIHLADGSIVWLHVRGHEPARLRPLADITGEVRNQLLLQKAQERAAAVAAGVAKSLNAGATLADVAARENLSWQEFADANRQTQIAVPGALKTAFRLPRPGAGKVSADSLAAGQSYVLVAVSKVVEGDASLGAEASQLRTTESEARGQQEFMDYIRYLRETGKVVVTMKSDSAPRE